MRISNADAFSSSLRRLTMAALLIVSGRSEGESGGEEAAAADSVRDGCRSVVFVDCPLARQPATAATRPGSSPSVTKQNLDARRLRPMREQADPNAVEVTAERPTSPEPDPWEGFQQGVAKATVPRCSYPYAAPPHQPFQAQGLLALPFVVYPAATGECH